MTSFICRHGVARLNYKKESKQELKSFKARNVEKYNKSALVSFPINLYHLLQFNHDITLAESHRRASFTQGTFFHTHPKLTFYPRVRVNIISAFLPRPSLPLISAHVWIRDAKTCYLDEVIRVSPGGGKEGMEGQGRDRRRG